MVKHENEVEVVAVTMEGGSNIKKQTLANPRDGYNGFMRMFIIGETGNTPFHSHDWYHLNYVVEGEGVVTIDNKVHHISKGSVAYIPGGVKHGFKNTGKGDLRFLCLIPIEGGSY